VAKVQPVKKGMIDEDVNYYFKKEDGKEVLTWDELGSCKDVGCCSVLQCVAVGCSVLQCVAKCCSLSQYIAVCCSVLQCVAIAEDSKEVPTWNELCMAVGAVCCSVLQCVAVCCSVLQLI